MNKNRIRSIFPILVFTIGAAIESLTILFDYDADSIEVILVWIIALAFLILGYRFLYLNINSDNLKNNY